MYRVLIPFNMGGERLSRHSLISDEIESSKNFHSLKMDKYIEPMEDRYGVALVPHCYIVTKSRGFDGKGVHYDTGDFLDLRGKGWRNETALLKAAYIRNANQEEVELHCSPGSDGATPGPAEPPKLYNNTGWLVKRYKGDGASIPEMAEEAKCSTSTLWTALKKHNIKTRSVGRPVAEI